MPLSPGTRLGPYEVVAPLGAGGMGEVYRARDTRLGREVAVKVLPEHLSADSEVLARFEREAKTISSFNHPHICTLFDVGQEADTHFLVMELIEGKTLAEVLDRGPLEPAEVLRLGAQIADALDRAHRAGVIHRDLKPSNVMITKAGAKLMDFGLARPALPESQGASQSVSPTMSRPLTTEGSIVGTFQYMAPEQLEGAESDARSDIWGLGCVLYEMATGKPAFQGKSQASLIGAIMHADPAPLSSLQPLTPPALEQLVRACLKKDPEERLQTVHDAKLQLEWIAEGGSRAGVPAPVAARRRGREQIAWAVAAMLAITLGALVARSFFVHSPKPHAVRLAVPFPEKTVPYTDPSVYSFSPDGTMLAFVAGDSAGPTSIWIRDLGSLEARRLPGTEGAAQITWSPDSRSLAYSTLERLMRVEVAGGNPEPICPLSHFGRGVTWNRDGVLVLAPTPEGPLARVSANGGKLEPVTKLDSLETGHRYPAFLPDGRHFLFAVLPGVGGEKDIFIGDLETGKREFLLRTGGVPQYADPGYLIYTRNDRIVAHRFDAQRRRLLGEPVSLGDEPAPTQWESASRVTVARSGPMAYLRGRAVNTTLARFDPTGRRLGTIPAPAARYEALRISPDKRFAAVIKRDTPSETSLWSLDLERGTMTRLTTGSRQDDAPVWSPDGNRIVFSSNIDGPWELYEKEIYGSEPERKLRTSSSLFKYAYDWSGDGKFVIYAELNRETSWDLWMIPMEGEGAPQLYLQTPFEENRPVFSPDGKWVAYQSFESGRPEIVVNSFPTPGRRYQISRDGGLGPAWSADGKQIIYLNRLNSPTVCPVSWDETEFHSGTPRSLGADFPTSVAGALAADASFVLLSLPEEGGNDPAPLTVVFDWQAQLESK